MPVDQISIQDSLPMMNACTNSWSFICSVFKTFDVLVQRIVVSIGNDFRFVLFCFANKRKKIFLQNVLLLFIIF